jgi:hypothetical protein
MFRVFFLWFTLHHVPDSAGLLPEGGVQQCCSFPKHYASTYCRFVYVDIYIYICVCVHARACVCVLITELYYTLYYVMILVVMFSINVSFFVVTWCRLPCEMKDFVFFEA